MAGVSEGMCKAYLVNQSGGIVLDRFVELKSGGGVGYPTVSSNSVIGISKESRSNATYCSIMDQIGTSTWVEWVATNGTIVAGDKVTSDISGRALKIPTNATPVEYMEYGKALSVNTNGTEKLVKIQFTGNISVSS